MEKTGLDEITVSIVAMHCCKAHATVNRKMGNSTPCKIVPPENILQLSIHNCKKRNTRKTQIKEKKTKKKKKHRVF